MRGLFRLAAVGTCAVAAIAILTSSGGAADAPGTYNVSATGSVLTFTALNALDISGAASSAGAGSGKATTATGSGITSPLGNSTATASEGTAGASNTPAQSCGPFPSESVVVAAVGSACGQATASEDANGNPTATGTGSLPQVTVGTGLSALTAPISSTVSSTVTTLLAPVQSALSAVNASAGAALPSGIDLNTLISDLENLSLSQVASLVTVNLGTSTSSIATSTNANGDTVETATATTKGTTIELLPGLLSGAPLATVTVGDNSATTAIDRTTGAVTASDDPSDVSVTIAGQTINVGEGTGPTPILAGTPLASTIEVGGGSATPGQGTGSAQAGDVELDLLTGVSGGIDLDLVTSQTSADGAPAAAGAATPAASPVATAAPSVVPNVTSVHTGEYWAGTLPVILVSGMAALGLILIARRRIAAAARALHPFARPTTTRSGGPPPGPASGTSSVPPPVPGPARRQPR